MARRKRNERSRKNHKHDCRLRATLFLWGLVASFVVMELRSSLSMTASINKNLHSLVDTLQETLQQLQLPVRVAENTTAITNDTATAISYDGPRIVYACVTSPPTYEGRAVLVQQTWASSIRRPDRFIFASNAALPDNSTAAAWINPHGNGQTTWQSAQGLFLSVLLFLPLDDGEWLFLADDDAFVVTHHVRALARTLNASLAALHANTDCFRPWNMRHSHPWFWKPSLCGGGGSLWSPAMVHSLRRFYLEAEPEQQAYLLSSNHGKSQYDAFVSAEIIQHKLGQLVMNDAFLVGPPQTYQHIPNRTISFHYVNADAKQNRRHEELYTELFQQYYRNSTTTTNVNERSE